MDQGLIDKIKQLTGKEDEQVTSFLDGLSLDDIYTLIDSDRRGDDAKMMSVLAPLKQQDVVPPTQDQMPQEPQQPEQPESPETNVSTDDGKRTDDVEEAMKDKHLTPIKVEVPKPRDTEAKELATNPLFRPKKEPSKKERILRKETKHKGRGFDPFIGEGVLEEGVMGFSAMPAIKKMLTLAGRPEPSDAEVAKAMEDFMGQFADHDLGKFGDDCDLRISDIATPVGTSIPTGPLDGALAALGGDFDAEIDAVSVEASGALTNIQNIRNAFQIIASNLPEVKVSEFAEVRELLADLMSRLDRMANNITGK